MPVILFWSTFIRFGYSFTTIVIFANLASPIVASGPNEPKRTLLILRSTRVSVLPKTLRRKKHSYTWSGPLSSTTLAEWPMSQWCQGHSGCGAFTNGLQLVAKLFSERLSLRTEPLAGRGMLFLSFRKPIEFEIKFRCFFNRIRQMPSMFWSAVIDLKFEFKMHFSRLGVLIG